MYACLRGPNNLLKLFTKLKIKPDFPSLGDVKSKPRPDMNIKVAAFTVSEKSINMAVTAIYLSSVISLNI